MTIIGVAGVPTMWTLKRFMNVLFKAKVIKGRFEALNFDTPRAGVKTAYIRLSDQLNPQQVLLNFGNLKLTSKAVFTAFIANNVPNLPVADKPYKRGNDKMPKQQKLQNKAKKAQAKAQQRISKYERAAGVGKPAEWILKATHKELLEEIISKYTKLTELSKKTDHKLLDAIAHTLFERLAKIMFSDPDSWDTCFKLSKAYRKAHPHFADFQMILSHLHQIEDASGAPRTQLQERELAVFGPNTNDMKLSPGKHYKVLNAYAEKMVEKVTQHIESLDSSNPDQMPEGVARRRVYQELKKSVPYLSAVVRHVIGRDTQQGPDQPKFHRMRVYGEPFIPHKETMYPALQRVGACAIVRSSRLYNLLLVNVQLTRFNQLAALDGTEHSGAKLVVRQSGLVSYPIKQSLIDEMTAIFGRPSAEDQPEDREMADDQNEEWGDDENLEMWM